MLKRTFAVFVLIAVLGISFPMTSFAAVGDYTGTSFETRKAAGYNGRGITGDGTNFYIVDDFDDEVYHYNSSDYYDNTHFDTAASGAGNATGIIYYNGFLWITDSTDDEVYKYQTDGTYTSVSFDTAASGNGAPVGITVGSDFFYIVDNVTDEVYKYNPDGTYTSTHFDTAAGGSDNPSGIAYDGTDLWILDDTDDEVYKYNTDGTYTGTHFDTAASGAASVVDIAFYNSNFWVYDNTDREVYKYNSSGVYQSYHFTVDVSDSPYGIVFYNNAFWVTDAPDSEVYKYDINGDYTGVHFDTAGLGITFPYSFTEYNDFFWIFNFSNGLIYKINPDGTSTGVTFDTSAESIGVSYGMTFYNNFLWITSSSNDAVYKYNSDGTYTGTSFSVAGNGLTDARGITELGGYLWIVDNTTDEVYKYQTDGTYTGVHFDTALTPNTTPNGIELVGNYFWVINGASPYRFAYKYVAIADTTPPTVQTLFPPNNDGAVPVNTNLIITFDEAVSVETGNISIYNASDDSLVEAIDVTSGQVTGDGTDTITINPTADLVGGPTDYYIQVDATAFDDLAGNSFAGILDENTWFFTTDDETAPIISEVTPVSTPSTLTTPAYTFTTNEAGDITYGGSCASATTTAVSGSNTITFNALALGTYTDCTITVTDALNNDSNVLAVTSFSIVAPPSSGGSSGSRRKAVLHTENPISPSPILTLPPVPSFMFLNNLFLGMTNPDVKELQKYLNTHGYPVAPSGPGSSGNETTKFGALTKAALIKFQIAKNIKPAVGFFGPITRGVVNSQN